ncbi:hypothetical protein Goshw_028955 [Gossypium schwendimanii]|uniref:Uncharacterized protein n=1 Tax=Gossypium schwendimanii TaxID=34291 RepID=A0A7J9N199_GOSSC|nr:hypothetical protein [Gossypium schwendimanii]
MGSQTSKVDHENDEIQPKVPPLLTRKLQEIEKRRFGSSLSKQILLQHCPEDGSCSDRKSSAVLSLEPDDDNVGSANIAPQPMVSDMDILSVAGEGEHKEDGNNAEARKLINKETRSMEKLSLEEKEAHKKIVEEIRRANEERRPCLTCPVSPSFKFYLTENEKEDDCSSKDDLLIKGSLSDTDIDAAKEIFESVSSTEEPSSKLKRRGRRKMRFRRVIPTGKPVKNFLKVKSCYYPSCGDQKLNRHYSKSSSNVKS